MKKKKWAQKQIMAGVRRVEYIMSRRGTSQILLDGYIYNKNVTKVTCQHWTCVSKTCNGRCTTTGDFLKNVTEHNHPPENPDVYIFQNNLRKRAREEIIPLQGIYNEEIAMYDPQTSALFPSFPSLKSALYRHRKNTLPTLPTTRAEVNLDDPWISTSDGRPFLLFEDGQDEKMLVFATQEQLSVLQEADIIYMDGTFSSCPSLWNQLYIIHTTSGSTMFPLVYALLPDRRMTTYLRFFNELKIKVQEKLNQPLSPSTVQVDFEMAAIRSVQEAFPDAEIKGCFFHFTQAVWRKVQELGLSVLYKDDEFTRQWIRRAAGLPLLPIGDVQDTWLDAMNSSPDVLNAEAFNDYMVINWVDDDARFPLPMWNHNSTIGTRTNNNLEGFHHRLNNSLSHRHPNIFRFIETIKKVESAERAKLAQLSVGAAPPPRKRVYRDVENRIARLKEQLQRGEKSSMEFLDAIGHLLKLG